MNPHPFSLLRGSLAALVASLAAGHGLAQTNPDPPIPVIEFGTPWRYFDTGAAPPAIGGVASWKAANYDAEAAGSTWKTGFGLFGYGDNLTYGQVISFGPNPNAKFITTYFWKKFQLPQGATHTLNATAPGLQYKSYELGIMRDDGVAVYVNGVEKLLSDIEGTRDNLPSSPTAINNTTLASSPLDGDSETSVVSLSVTGAAGALLPFPQFNVIAVELHQSINTTPDARFDLYLNLTDANPCYGAAKPGIKALFQEPGQGVGATRYIHLRDALGEPPFEDQDTEMNWESNDTTAGSTSGAVDADWVDGTLLPSTALSLFGAGTFTWDSEPIDVRNFTNVVVTAKVQAVKRAGTANFNSSDKMDYILRYSGDGASYRDLPWQTISTTAVATGTVWTDLVAENAQKKAIVPTSATVPLNTGANNWRTRGFDDAAWPTGTKGAGYENNPADAVNYTPLLDPNFNFQSQTFGANPKKTVVYMRSTFAAQPSRADFTKLQLRVKYDDGFIAYLNDVEVARKNVAATLTPTSNPPIGPASLASAQNGDPNAVLYEDFDITSKLTNVETAQTNVLAIYVFNDAGTSSDMIVWPVLQMGKPGGPPPITLASLDDGNVETYTTLSTATAGAGGVSLIPPNAQAIKIRFRGTITAPNEFNKAFYFDDIEVTGTPIAADSYESFIKVKAPFASPAELDAKADIDGDSILNICEYGFGTDPSVPGLYTMVNGQLRPINPEVSYDVNGFILIKFRLPGGNITGNAGDGYEIKDLNIRPQMSVGDFTLNGWQDGVIGTSKFVQLGLFEENNDGTVTVTCRSLDPVQITEKQVYVRVRVGVTYPSYLAGKNAECPF